MRKQDLPAVRCVHDARGTVHFAAVEVVVTPLVDAAMQSATHAQLDAVALVGSGQRLLHFEHGKHRVERAVEGGVNAVPLHLHDDTAMALDGRARDGVMARERRAHPLRILFPETGAALDVGEEVGNGTSRLRHAGCIAAAHKAWMLRVPCVTRLGDVAPCRKNTARACSREAGRAATRSARAPARRHRAGVSAARSSDRMVSSFSAIDGGAGVLIAPARVCQPARP
ncbi:MAG TPA: hypothetical protein VFR86_20445 [Burkholderiaceae bacterium]|nr:hypothetical protein [Burkholderiaceae bacterium]